MASSTPLTQCLQAVSRAASPNPARRVPRRWRFADIMARAYSTSRNTEEKPRVAVLFQALEPPIIDGTRKPKKPGGYRDSGADIAYNLHRAGVKVITPVKFEPRPTKEDDWCFPDNEEGILNAIVKGATHLWANTILFADHPLQNSGIFGRQVVDTVRVVGQGPLIVEKYDDKDYVNDLLRREGCFTMPQSWTLRLDPTTSIEALISEVSPPYPVVAKPARGRGSHGVKVCHDVKELTTQVESLAQEGLNVIMVEEYLAGEEATVTVMPPTGDRACWSLPDVSRFNHHNGIAPYNGTVAVTSNSKAIVRSKDPAYEAIQRECEMVGLVLGVTAPIRIDVRRFRDGSDFAIFDVNMKPNMTGPGRPGRDDQASLTLMAAEALGWDYPRLLREILKTSSTLRALRELEPMKSL